MKNKKIFALLMVLVVLSTLVMACGGSGKTTLNVLNWGEYLEPELIQEFEKANPDIKINYSTTVSNEEMYTVSTTKDSKVDLIVPSDYLVERLINEDMAAELDLSNIPNFKYVEDAAKTRTFDPDSKYSIPYMMGTVGIVYNKTLVDDPVDSWEILWDEKYSGKIMMYDSIRDSLMVGLSRLGYDINTTDQAQVEEAGELLKEQRPLVLSYGTDNIQYDMIGGSVALAVDYSGAAAAAIMENDDLDYIVPKEGSNIWVDNLLVMKNSKNKETAERFINFLCDPEVAARNAEYIGYTTPNKEAEAYIDAELLENPAYLITDDIIARCAYFRDLGDGLSIYNDVWMDVKTSK
ncbi:MAG: ABC transporter substrate-binding protein [Christensenellaceae bacterium]|jgi:spermidine/putrescine-binding protein